MSVSAVQGTFTTAGQFAQMQAERGVNISLNFGDGEVVYERSLDGGLTFFFYMTITDDVSFWVSEPEPKSIHRLRVATFGTPIAYRISN